MEWRQQTSVSCADAFNEAQRWIEEVTGKLFGCSDFRAALENGVLLCDLINQLKPGIIKRVNRLSTPIAGLDNVNVFLKACGKLGLNESQLFHPGDLQDLSTRVTLRRDESSRRLKNVPAPDADANIHKCRDMSRIRVMMVLITIYWLGRKAQLDAFYTGPQLNFKAFEGLIGFTLSKAEGGNVFGKDGGYRESWLTERDERQHMRPSYKRENSLDSVDSLDARTLRPNSEGCGSDAEAEQVFRMETPQLSVHQNKGHVPAPLLRRKQGQEETGGVCTSPLSRVNQNQVRPETPVQVNPGWIWSKSLSDIPMVYPARKLQKENTIHDVSYDANPTRERNQKNTRKSSVTAKDSEAQWQDDLTKWKNRRRSTKSDLRRNSQDREHVINQMSNGAVTNIENNEASNRDQPTSPCRNNPAPRLHSTSPPSKSSSSDLKPHTRALLARSYATEAPFSPAASLSPQTPGHTQGSVAGVMPASDGNILGEETHFASLASDGAGVTTPSLDCPFTSQTQFKAQDNLAPSQPTSELNQPENVFTNQTSTLTTTMPPNKATHSTSTSDPTTSVSSPQELQFCADPNVNQAAVDPLDYLSQQNHKSQEERQKMSWEPSVEQNRGQQAAGVYKYLYRAGSWSGSASLPRGYRRSDGSTRLSSAITARPFGTKQSRMSSLPRLCNVDDNQGVLLNSEKEKSLSPPNKSLLKRQTATGHLRGQYQASIRQKKANQAKQKSAKQMERKEERGANISSQANGYHHQPYAQTQILPQPYSNPQSQHSRSLSQPSKMDHSDMRVSLSLKPNSRPDFGFQTHWDSTGARVTFIQPGSPAELCRLSVGDEIVSVDGLTVAQMSYNQWTEKMTSALQAGSLTMDIRRYGNKDWSMSEGSHHNLPGQSRMTLNLTSAAPVLIGYPDHHANNTAAATESPVTKAAKFNGQTDNVIQGNMMDGGFADGRRTGRSKGGSESAISDLQVPSLSPSSSSWSWDREEDRKRQEKWQEEQERLLQEQYQRDQKRLEAEWQRAQQDVMGDFSRKLGMTNGVENLGSFQLPVNASANKIREEERSYNRDKLKTAGSGSSSNTHGVYNDKITEPDWAVESCGFAQLSPAHRAKSMSTPALGSPHRQMRGDQRKIKDQSVSKAEKERQQILEEMKKRTQLLTDNSWIRQRSSSFYKEPVYVGVPMKRYESLDDLDTLRQSPVSASTFSYPRPHSAAAGYCAPSRNSSSRYSTGAILTQRNPSVDSPHQGRTVSGRRTCCVCERVLGSGAAMVIEALGLYFHLACFQCVGCHRHLGRIETGVHVQIRNKKPHCERCYFQLKCGY